MINLKDLIGFKNEADKAGYEQDKPKHMKQEKDDSTSIWYESGDWKLHDNFFGGEPYGGRTVTFHKNKPIHITVYYGNVYKSLNPNDLYPFLRKALRTSSDKMFREPKKYQDGNFKYLRTHTGSAADFYLEEKIYLKRKIVYKAIFIGGLVDQRRGY